MIAANAVGFRNECAMLGGGAPIMIQQAALAGFDLRDEGLFYDNAAGAKPEPRPRPDAFFVCDDWAETLEFLGYNRAQWVALRENVGDKQSFTERLFRFLSSTPYLPARFSVAGVPQPKAESSIVHRFNDWLKTVPFEPYDWEGRSYAKAEFLEQALGRFHDFRVAFHTAEDRLVLESVFKARFNGFIVSEITGLVGRELGVVIKRMRTVFGGHSNLVDFVVNSHDNDIAAIVKRCAEGLVDRYPDRVTNVL